jgi:hypothetical protein
MRSYTKFIFFIIAAFLAHQAVAQINRVEYNWNLKKDKDDIAIYTSKVTSSKYHAFKSVILVIGTTNSLVSLVQGTSTRS